MSSSSSDTGKHVGSIDAFVLMNFKIPIRCMHERLQGRVAAMAFVTADARAAFFRDGYVVLPNGTVSLFPASSL